MSRRAVYLELLQSTVGDVLRSRSRDKMNLAVCRGGDSVVSVVNMLAAYRTRCVVKVDKWGVPRGIISISDLIKFMIFGKLT